jgi:RNA polymerase sigma factor (sigma-70 family)
MNRSLTIKTTAQTDIELVQLYQLTGHQQVLADLYLRYTDLVYGTCIKYLKDQELAKDAVMNIYEELCVKLKTHQVENIKSWLYVVTKNHCLMQLRKDKKFVTTEFQPEFMQSTEVLHLDGVMQKEQQFNRLENCIEKLQDEQQLSVRLFYLENRCYNEITEITGFEWNKVRSLIQNGKRNLKICMEKNDE